MNIYQKILAVYAKLRAAINSKSDRVEISSKFSSGKIYLKGELVIYDDQIFICNTLHIGPWDPNHFALATVADALSRKADKSSIQSFAAKSDIADEFRTSWNYKVGRLTIYNGVLYRCIVYHPAGEWDSSHFSRANVDDVMGTKISQEEAHRFADKTSICNEFDANQAYDVDDLVIHNGYIWRCATAHQGPWSSNDFVPNATVNEVLRSKIDSGEMSGKADKSEIAPEFSTSTGYIAGELVYHEGILYRCVVNHVAGAWNAGHFSVANVSDALAYDIVSPGTGEVYLNSHSLSIIDASSLSSLTVFPAIPPEDHDKVTDMLLRVDTGENGCTITHGAAGVCICSNVNWNVLPANSFNAITYTYMGPVSQSDADPVFLVGVVSYPKDSPSE